MKLVERDRDKAFELSDQLGDVMIVNGDCRDVDLLEEEGVGHMDAFIAVTGNSETNIMSCLVAQEPRVPKTIALVENIEYINLSMNIGIDTLMINKKHVAASQIFRYVRQGELINMANLHGMPAEVLEFEVAPGSKLTRGRCARCRLPGPPSSAGTYATGRAIRSSATPSCGPATGCWCSACPSPWARWPPCASDEAAQLADHLPHHGPAVSMINGLGMLLCLPWAWYYGERTMPSCCWPPPSPAPSGWRCGTAPATRTEHRQARRLPGRDHGLALPHVQRGHALPDHRGHPLLHGRLLLNRYPATPPPVPPSWWTSRPRPAACCSGAATPSG